MRESVAQRSNGKVSSLGVFLRDTDTTIVRAKRA
jgi:hypothetical protein